MYYIQLSALVSKQKMQANQFRLEIIITNTHIPYDMNATQNITHVEVQGTIMCILICAKMPRQ